MQYLKQHPDGSRTVITEQEYTNGWWQDKFDHIINTTTLVVVRDRAGTFPRRRPPMSTTGKYYGKSMTGYTG